MPGTACYKDFNFCYSFNCSKENLLHKISLFLSSEDQPFSVCTNWQSDSFSEISLTSHHFSSRSKSLSSAMSSFTGDVEHRPKGDGRPPDLHLNFLWICSQLSPIRISTWCMILGHSWLGLAPTIPVSRAEMLTTIPPSPRSQHLFSLYMLQCWFSHLNSTNHLVTGSFVFLENFINLFPALHTVFSSSANQKSATLQVLVVSQSECSDVTLGSSRRFSIKHGNYFNTFLLFLHSARTIH